MISVSLVDFLGNIEHGVGVILSLGVEDKFYEMMYWFNPEDQQTLVIEDQFYRDYPWVRDIMTLESTPLLIQYIQGVVLPPRAEMFAQFLT